MNMKPGVVPKHINDPEYYKGKAFLFLDISGFTPLCDKYIQESSYGAEKIGDLVNGVFNPIIDYIYECGGDVISFAGDAIFAAVDKKKAEDVKNKAEEVIIRQKFDKNLSIKPEVFEGSYFPYSVNSDGASLFCFTKGILKETRLINDPFPEEIYDIFKSNFKGELRAVPVFFVHIDSKFGTEKISPLLEYLAENSRQKAVYINKIEKLDKGWMVLLSAGAPVYAADAPVKIYDLLKEFSKKAKENLIPVRIGGTLERGYCGIIGNEKRWEFTFLGSNVNLAARIAVKAEHYKVFADSSFAGAVKTMLNTLPAGKQVYKGVGEREIFEITGKKRDKKSVFVGREEELRSCLDFFAGGRKALVILNGPSGIGKTVLAERIIETLGQKNLIRLKGIYGSDEPDGLFKNSEFFKGLNSAQIIRKFSSISKPVLIYIDDLHFADDRSLFTFRRMINEGNPYVNFIATTIGKEKIKITPLCFYEPLIMDIKPFSQKDIQNIIRLVTGIELTLKASREIEKTTHGNPLFVSGILPYLNAETKKSGEIPYSLQEVILLKLNQIPENGAEFIDGGSVYGDIFDRKVVKDVVKLKDKLYNTVLSKAESEGIIRKSANEGESEFANTIIRETIYERLLKKKIDFFRKKIAESILDTGTVSVKKKIKAFNLFFEAEDQRALELAAGICITLKGSKEGIEATAILRKAFSLSVQKKITSKTSELIEILTGQGNFEAGTDVTRPATKAALEVKDWKGKEKLLLDIARLVFATEMRAPEGLLERYGELKGEDKYYKWTKARTHCYQMDEKEVCKLFRDIRNSFFGSEAIYFYFDYVWYAFFLPGNREMEKEGMNFLYSAEKEMDEPQTIQFLLLKNTIAMHRDDMERSKECLDELMKYRDINSSDRFGILNDYSILYSNLAYNDFKPSYMKKSLNYSEKSCKLLKDFQKESELPLMTTNLATYYLSLGRIRQAYRSMLEGLYYGYAINHPVEVPYTKSRIAFITASSGSYDLSLKIAEEVAASIVSDIKSGAYTIKYLYGEKNRKDLKKAEEYSAEIAKFGTGKCYWEMYSLLTAHAFVTRDLKEMKKLRQKLIDINHFTQRQAGKFRNDLMISILGLMTGIKEEEGPINDKLSKLKSLNVDFGSVSKAYYALGISNNDSGMLIKAKKYALKMMHYPFVLRIEKDLFEMTGDVYWSKRAKITEHKLAGMNRLSTIEEFLKV